MAKNNMANKMAKNNIAGKTILQDAIPPHLDKRTLTGIAMILFSSIGFAMLGIIAKLAFQNGVGVTQFMFWRALLCLPAFWIFALIKAKESRLFQLDRKSIFYALVAGVLSNYLTSIAGLKSILYINANLASLLFAVYPMFVIIIDAIINRKLPSMSHFIVLALSLLGVYLIMGGGGGKGMLSQNLVGTMWGLFSAFCSAVYVIMNQKVTRKVDSIAFTTLCLTGGFFAIALHYVIFTGMLLESVTVTGFTMIVLSSLIFATCMWIFSKGVKRIGASRSALINNIGPFFTVIFAYLMLGEKLTMLQLSGGVIVVAAILLLERKIFVVLKLKKVFSS